jgi:hypothetical protein
MPIDPAPRYEDEPTTPIYSPDYKGTQPRSYPTGPDYTSPSYNPNASPITPGSPSDPARVFTFIPPHNAGLGYSNTSPIFHDVDDTPPAPPPPENLKECDSFIKNAAKIKKNNNTTRSLATNNP